MSAALSRSAVPSSQKPASSRGILLVAHGERGGRMDNAALLDLSNRVRKRLDGVEVEAGVLKGSPSLQDGWERLSASERFIYPFFMSDGFFVSRILPKKVREAVGVEGDNLAMLPPFGVSPLLAGALLASLKGVLADLGREDEKAPLLIAAHGASIDKQSSFRTNQLAQALRDCGQFGPISCAFLDEAPHLHDVVGSLDPRTLVLPLFNGLGSHGMDDMAELQAMSPDGCHYLPPIGGEAWVADLVAHDIHQMLARLEKEDAHLDAAQ